MVNNIMGVVVKIDSAKLEEKTLQQAIWEVSPFIMRQIRQQGPVLLVSVGLIGVAAMIFGFSRSFPLSMAALMLAGASDSVSSIIRSAIRQLHTPDDLRGRMTSVNQIFFMGGPYLGDVKSGFLGGLIGVPLAVAIGGAACVVSVGWIARQWPGLRRYDGAQQANA